MNSLINSENFIAVWAVIVGFVFFAMYAEKRFKWAKVVGAALICLVGGMLLSNIGIMPKSSEVYGDIWGYVTPVAIPMVLFSANIKKIWKESGKMLFMFLIACGGTMIGVLAAAALLQSWVPELHKVAAMFMGSQTGGSMNLVVQSEIFGISEEMFNAVYIADTLTFAFTLFTLVLLPSIGFLRKRIRTDYPLPLMEVGKTDEDVSVSMSIFSIAKALFVSLAIVGVSIVITDFVNSVTTNEIITQLFGQKYLVLTLITVILATAFPKQMEIKGAQEIGLFFMYIFFVAVSIEADFMAVLEAGPVLILFSFITFLGIVVTSLVFGKLFKFSLEEISISANAALGGPPTAAAAAIARGYTDLVTPAVLVGTLGYILGNYFGVFVGNLVLQLFGI